MELPPHPSSWCWSTLTPLQGTVRKPVFCPLPLLLSAACGKFTSLGTGAWRKVARESLLHPRAFANAPQIMGSTFSQGPLSAGHMGILVQNLYPVCFPLHPNGAPVWLISILWLIWRLLKQTLGDPQQRLFHISLSFPNLIISSDFSDR